MKDFDNFKDSFTDLKNALSKLNEIINFEIDNKEIKRDSTIQRFEFCYELIWKNLKRILEIEGFNPKSPRETFEFAYKNDIIKNEELWLNMIRDRNIITHVYDQDEIDKIYNNIVKNYYSEMQKCFDILLLKVKNYKKF